MKVELDHDVVGKQPRAEARTWGSTIEREALTGDARRRSDRFLGNLILKFQLNRTIILIFFFRTLVKFIKKCQIHVCKNYSPRKVINFGLVRVWNGIPWVCKLKVLQKKDVTKTTTKITIICVSVAMVLADKDFLGPDGSSEIIPAKIIDQNLFYPK